MFQNSIVVNYERHAHAKGPGAKQNTASNEKTDDVEDKKPKLATRRFLLLCTTHLVPYCRKKYRPPFSADHRREFEHTIFLVERTFVKNVYNVPKRIHRYTGSQKHTSSSRSPNIMKIESTTSNRGHAHWCMRSSKRCLYPTVTDSMHM